MMLLFHFCNPQSRYYYLTVTSGAVALWQLLRMKVCQYIMIEMLKN